MAVWAAGIALVLGVGAFLAGDPATLFSGLAEIAAVLALFTIVYATEAGH